MRRVALLAAALVALAWPAAGLAQQGEAAVTAAGSGADTPLPVTAFTSPSQLRSARLSPDGTRLAYLAQQDGKTFIIVRDAGTLASVDGGNLGEDVDVNWFRWTGNNGLLLSLMGKSMLQGTEYSFSMLFHYDLERGALRRLALERQDVDGDDVIFTDPAGGYILVSLSEYLYGPPGVWRWDLADPAAEPVEIIAARNDISSWVADETGAVRIGLGFSVGGRWRLLYRPTGEGEFRVSSSVRPDAEELDAWGLSGLHSGSDTGYAFNKPDGENNVVIQAFNFATAEPGEILYRVDGHDVTGTWDDPARNVIGLGYLDDSERVHWLDPQMARHQAGLQRALPGSQISITDWSDSRDRLLVMQSGPSDPGALYVYTPGERNLALLAEFRPGLPPARLGRSSAFTYAARDGTPIRAFLTLPPGEGTGPFPLIVYPHGGPYGIYDEFAYEDWAQLMATRGYAVVRPNFRGSGGYGDAFERLGDGQIGRAMQDDLDDVVAYLVANGTAAQGRVCLVGASYGGYAALWGVIRNPETYRCAASWAGVTHWERQLRYQRDFLWGRNRRLWADRVNGDTSAFDLDDVSPAVQAERLTRPVLLAHGEEDGRVPFSQFEVMRGRAPRAMVQTLVLEESGHNFGSDEDHQAWLEALMAFLARHNPVD